MCQVPREILKIQFLTSLSGLEPSSVVSNVSDCRYRGCEFDPDPVPYFRGDRS